MELDKYQTLLVRACKDKRISLDRLRRIWEIRTWVTPSEETTMWISEELAKILVDSKVGMSMNDWMALINEINPDYNKYFSMRDTANAPYWDRVCYRLAQKIRYTCPDTYWDNYNAGAKWRNKEK